MQDILGFHWQQNIIPNPKPGDIGHAIFRVKKLFPEFVWNTTMLEDNPYTFPEVQTLLDGVTVGGHKLSDEQQVLYQAQSWQRLLDLVQQNKFSFNKEIFCELNALVACEEALAWGVFRSGNVAIAGTQHKPLHPEQLDKVFTEGCAFINSLSNVIERSLAFALFGALNQFFYDGNKRTSRLMMNGELLRYGLDAISVPAARKQEFNQKMLHFYDSKDGTEMMKFLLSCAPE